MSKEQKLSQIQNLNKELQAQLANDLTVQKYFKDRNILGEYARIFESDWIVQESQFPNYSTKDINSLLPLDVYFTYEKEFEIPEYLLPFVKVSMIVKPTINTEIVGLMKFQQYQIGGNWITVKADGDVIYDGPDYGVRQIANSNPPYGPYLFENDGQLVIPVDKENPDYPGYSVYIKYPNDIYRVTFKYHDGIHNNIYTGLITSVTLDSGGGVFAGDVSLGGTYGSFGTVGGVLGNNGSDNIFVICPLEGIGGSSSSFIGKCTTITVGPTSITGISYKSTVVFSFSDPNAQFSLSQCNIPSAFLGLYFFRGGDPLLEVISCEKAGVFPCLDIDHHYNLNFNPNSFGSFPNFYILYAQNQDTSAFPQVYDFPLPYNSIEVHLNPDPWPRTVKTTQFGTTSPDFVDSGYNHTFFNIKDFTLKNSHPSKYILFIDTQIVLKAPSTAISTITATESIRQGNLTSHTQSIFHGPPTGTLTYISYDYGTTSFSTFQKSRQLYQPTKQDVQIKILVDLINPYFFKENRTYIND